jgi:SAM-dependent methyltransferase
MIERIVAASPGLDFLDVGCGTGIEARQFRAAGRRVLGVEPDPRMADFARGTGLEVEVATFEAWQPAGRTFDAVVSARPGTGSTPSRARPRRRASCGREACWRRSGTYTSFRPPWRRRSPRRTGEWPPTRR